MLDLIERLEKAKAGSFELDHQVAEAVFSHLDPAKRCEGGAGWYGPDDVLVRPPKPYTASLDAITALIGERLPGWSVVIRLPGEAKHKHTCEVAAPDDPAASITDPWPFRTSAGASSAPLAACATLLRAIQTKES